MSIKGSFYQVQADQCGHDSAAADLPHLREQFLRSQRAWQALADRETAIETARKAREDHASL